MAVIEQEEMVNISSCNVVTWPVMDYRKRMNAETALIKQIGRYRQMTGEQRLSISLDMHEMSCDIAREGISSILGLIRGSRGPAAAAAGIKSTR